MSCIMIIIRSRLKISVVLSVKHDIEGVKKERISVHFFYFFPCLLASPVSSDQEAKQKAEGKGAPMSFSVS